MAYLTIDLVITNSEWEYNATKKGVSKVKLQAELAVMDILDISPLVNAALRAALDEYDDSDLTKETEGDV